MYARGMITREIVGHLRDLNRGEPHLCLYAAELPWSGNLPRIGDPADSGCGVSLDRDRACGPAQHQHIDSSSAAPSDAITGLRRSARRRQHAPSDGPNKARRLTGDRSGDDIGGLARARELAIARA